MWQDRAGTSWVIFRCFVNLRVVTPPIPLGGLSLCGNTPGADKAAENSKLRAENSREGVNLGGQIHLGVPEASV